MIKPMTVVKPRNPLAAMQPSLRVPPVQTQPSVSQNRIPRDPPKPSTGAGPNANVPPAVVDPAASGAPRSLGGTTNAAPPAAPPRAGLDAMLNQDVTSIAAGMMRQDSPLMQKARADGAAIAASRGLLNSSIAAQSGEAAMLDKIVPLASQQADINYQTNEGGRNRDFTGGQNNLDRAADLQASLANRQAELQRLNLSIRGDATQADLNRRADLELAIKNNQAALDRENISNRAAADLAKLDLNTADRNAATTLLSRAYDNFETARQSILANPNLPADERNSMLQNATRMLESQVNYTRGLYGEAFDWPPNPWSSAPPRTPT